MNEKDKNLQEPAVSYGATVRLGDVPFEPVKDLDATLRAKGYITLEEFSAKYKRFL